MDDWRPGLEGGYAFRFVFAGADELTGMKLC
jgi:hypothetical protein